MPTRESKWKCNCCGWCGIDSELLTAPSPFRTDDELVACPQCRTIGDGFTGICDVKGCNSEITCGTAVKNGYATFSGDDSRDDYLRTCGKHKPVDQPHKPCTCDGRCDGFCLEGKEKRK